MPITSNSPATTAPCPWYGVTAAGSIRPAPAHLAIERKLAHSSGMIGLPLRLLAGGLQQGG